MTSQNSRSRSSLYRAATGALTGAALGLGLIIGASPMASAQPTTKAPEPPAPMMTADQALAIVHQDYDLGAGGGQLSKLIDQVLTLRNRGIRPSNANRQAIVEALDARPNQGPLIAALQSTLAYQRKVMAQSQGGQQAPSGGGAPPVAAPGSPGVPAWAPGNPLQQDGDTIFPMPGR
jgi:hypothetical protein